MPEDQVMAFRYGDWNALSGSYFKNFTRQTHTCQPFPIPRHWPLYRSFDYGFDMFSLGFEAVDEDGRSWVFRYYEHKDLVADEVAAKMKELTLPTEPIMATYAPPDMFWRQKADGKSVAEILMSAGVGVVQSSNNRVQGHMVMKNMLAPIPLRDPFVKSLFPEGCVPETLPGLMIFDMPETQKLLEDIESIQADESNPNDCAKQPHDVTHSVDMLRYYCISHVVEARVTEEKKAELDDDLDSQYDYDEWMCGGEVSEGYMNY